MSQKAASATESKDDASNAQSQLKLITDMGFAEPEARVALSRAKNNVEQAIHFLAEGDSSGDWERSFLKSLRHDLMGPPNALNHTITQFIRLSESGCHDQLIMRDLVNTRSVEFMEALLASPDEDKDAKQQQFSESENPSSPGT